MVDKKTPQRAFRMAYTMYIEKSYGGCQQTSVGYFRLTKPRIVLGLVKARLICASDPL